MWTMHAACTPLLCILCLDTVPELCLNAKLLDLRCNILLGLLVFVISSMYFFCCSRGSGKAEVTGQDHAVPCPLKQAGGQDSSQESQC